MTKRNSQNKLVFKVITPTKMFSVKDVQDAIDNKIFIDVIDFKTGKKLGRYTLSEFQLKF
ncbi:MAG: hypothetical protein WC525_09960 [Candidatus Thermoplasmatota archaeon]